MEFTTRRLIIKKFIPEYISLMYETWGSDLDVLRYIPEMKDIHSIDDFTDYIMRAYKDEYLIRSVIQEKDTNKIIGYVFLYQEDSRSKSVNIFIEKSHWGKGYGTEVLKICVVPLSSEAEEGYSGIYNGDKLVTLPKTKKYNNIYKIDENSWQYKKEG